MTSTKAPVVPEFENKNLPQFLIELQGWLECVEGVIDKKKQAHMIALSFKDRSATKGLS